MSSVTCDHHQHQKDVLRKIIRQAQLLPSEEENNRPFERLMYEADGDIFDSGDDKTADKTEPAEHKTEAQGR
jgi:hypothetical protein